MRIFTDKGFERYLAAEKESTNCITITKVESNSFATTSTDWSIGSMCWSMDRKWRCPTMTNILIRGMEMPDRRTVELMHTELACVSRECDRHCENCDLVQDRDELIVAFQEAIRVLETVANAVPLPERHGRLIDADAIEYTYTTARGNDDGHNWRIFAVGEDEIDEMPTIVPAEGGTE